MKSAVTSAKIKRSPEAGSRPQGIIMNDKPKKMRSAVILIIWLILWQAAAALIHNKIIFVGPREAVLSLVSQIGTGEFWRTIFSSFIRIAGGFTGAFLAGILMAALASGFSWLREFLEPPTALLQSVPVASFVILALIWIGSENLSVLITCLVVFPVIYRNVLEGIRQTDRKLLEMAQVFRMSVWKKIWYLYRPAVMPYLLAGCRISLGMAWKSGVAAEVIGVPDHSIGEKLYMAKIYLSTAELFAWTFVIIVVSWVFEKLFLRLLELFVPGRKAAKSAAVREKKTGAREAEDVPGGKGESPSQSGKALRGGQGRAENREKETVLAAQSVSKSYHGANSVLEQESLRLCAGDICCLMGPSGRGKTTMLRLLMGLEQPDSGRITGSGQKKISAVFQEDRLCDYLSGIDNIRIVSGKNGLLQDPRRLLARLLEPEALERPVRELSGGMRRRVAIARALAAGSEVILMDEPFTGLDEETRLRVTEIIRDTLDGRALLLVTHQAEDAGHLGARLVTLKERTGPAIG